MFFEIPYFIIGKPLYNVSDCVEYIWSWTDDTIINNNGSIIINDVQKSNWYYLHVKNSEDCLGYDSIYVVVGVNPYEAITPNNDGTISNKMLFKHRL